jgi:hypothetical protein
MVAVDNLLIENNVDVFDYEEGTHYENLTETTSPVVWSYVYPGCVVYRWCANTRRILHRLDCSKLGLFLVRIIFLLANNLLFS